jgi:hypothetical protein
VARVDAPRRDGLVRRRGGGRARRGHLRADHECRPLPIPLTEAFAHGVWYHGHPRLTPGEAPELRVHATEPSGRYLGTLAMLARLVRAHVEPATFELLYQPFASPIPVADLVRE